MSQTKNRHGSAGFTAIELILAVVIAAFIGAAVWYIIDSQKQDSKTQSSSSAQKSELARRANDVSHGTKTTKANPEAFVKEAYEAYIKALDKKDGGVAANAAIKPYLTDDAYAAVTAPFPKDADVSNRVVCGQAVPSSFDVALDTEVSTSERAVVQVNEKFGEDIRSPRATVDIASAKITKIECPGANY